MSIPFRSPLRRSSSGSSALIVTLLVIALCSTLILGIITQSAMERHLSSDNLQGRQARLIAQMALDEFLGTLQTTLQPYDTPFASAAHPATFWALAPGRIDILDFSAGTDGRPHLNKSVDLHTGDGTGAAARNRVDLNAADSYGQHPIWNGTNAQAMPVKWRTVLQDPGQAAATNNPIVGRYAYWVDDEGAKVNVNTADGSYNYDDLLSYGQGTPSAVRIDAVDSSTVTVSNAQSIAAQARLSWFSHPSEIARIPGVPESFATKNNFSLTAYSRSPEFTIFNEPRFQLVPTDLSAPGVGYYNGGAGKIPMNMITCSLVNNVPYNGTPIPMRSIYPTANQFTSAARKALWPAIPRVAAMYDNDYNQNWFASQAQITAAGSLTDTAPFTGGFLRFAAMQNVAYYLIGKDDFGATIRWPFTNPSFTSVTPGNPAKYTPRQVDSIVLQAFDMARTAGSNRNDDMTMPSMAPYGILGSQAVCGVGRAPRLTEFLFNFKFSQKLYSVSGVPTPDGGALSCEAWIERYLPQPLFHPKANLDNGVINANGQAAAGWGLGGGNMINHMDAPYLSNINQTPYYYLPPTNSVPITRPAGSLFSPSSFWMDNQITATAQDGDIAGIDFLGNSPTVDDPDPRASSYRRPDVPGHWYGKGISGVPTYISPLWQFNWLWPQLGTSSLNTRNFQVGEYLVSRNTAFSYSYPTRQAVSVGKPAVTSITLGGGLVFWDSFFSADSRGMFDSVPLASVAGPFSYDGKRRVSASPDISAAIPFPSGVVLDFNANQNRYVYGKVADPFVNKFPGDWQVTTSTTRPTTSMPVTFMNSGTSAGYYSAWHTTDDPASTDMAACWNGISRYDVTNAAWRNAAWQAALPSVGQLQYIRTGMMPDAGQSKGVPFRCLNFGPAGTQGSIPDWALLDLFTIPQTVYTQPASPIVFGTAAPQVVDLTYGGATSGRINLNGASLFPWATNNPAYRRTGPLRALFQGLRYNLDGKLTTALSSLSSSDADTLAGAIADYIGAHGPLSMAGQMCDIPAVNAYGATVNSTRNDIVSQSVGELVTQGNVFSVWVASQSVKKRTGNTNYGSFEAGDVVQAEARMRFIVERYLDLGIDNVPGNSKTPGADGIVGTADDPVDPDYNPADPTFKYRVLYAEEVQ